MSTASAGKCPSPCVVQVGFAGSRRLFDLPPAAEASRETLHRQVEEELIRHLRGLPERLQLGPQYSLCGISQIAIGADMLFTRACQTLQIAQRIFLPQPRQAYLHAGGKSGTPDFTSDQRAAAEQLLASRHILEERVVSDAPNRTDRFEDTNREIFRVSQVLICLRRAGAKRKRGGTSDLLRWADQQAKPILDLRVSLANGQARCAAAWRHVERFQPPQPPAANGDVLPGGLRLS